MGLESILDNDIIFILIRNAVGRILLAPRPRAFPWTAVVWPTIARETRRRHEARLYGLLPNVVAHVVHHGGSVCHSTNILRVLRESPSEIKGHAMILIMAGIAVDAYRANNSRSTR
jgi:hypothetical protein